MKVKIGDKIYNSDEQPIMIILSDKDKENITNMDKNCTKYCCFSDDIDLKKIENFMKD
jgi:hypothetical protein